LDETVAERAERHSQGVHVVRVVDVLLNARVGRPVVDQRSAGVWREDAVRKGTGPQLGDLTAAAGDRSLMALRARLRVVHGAQAAGDSVALLEGRTIR